MKHPCPSASRKIQREFGAGETGESDASQVKQKISSQLVGFSLFSLRGFAYTPSAFFFFWLHCTLVAVQRLSLVAEHGLWSTQAQELQGIGLSSCDWHVGS